MRLQTHVPHVAAAVVAPHGWSASVEPLTKPKPHASCGICPMDVNAWTVSFAVDQTSSAAAVGQRCPLAVVCRLFCGGLGVVSVAADVA